MEGAQVFSCATNSGFMSRLSKKDTENLFLKVENDKVSGKAYVCNAEGKNGYIDEFSFLISEIGAVSITEYNGAQALVFAARVSNIYGAKKAQIALPQLKNMDLVLGLLNRLKKNVENPEDDYQASTATKAPTPAVAPAPPVQNVMKTEPAVAPTPVAPVVQKEEKTPEPVIAKKEDNSSTSKRLSSEEFQKRMEKLVVLKDCGLLGEKEFNNKKIELVSEFCDLSEFNKKVQKMIALRDCGLLSETEFEKNRTDIIRECYSVDTSDMDEYRRNIQKLSYLLMGEVITEEEYEKNKQILVKEVDFELNDDNDTFVKKLKKLPVLKESDLITDAEYKQKVDDLFKMIDVSPNEPFEHMVDKLKKWPLLAEEQYITAAELKTKQKDMIGKCVNMNWTTLDELEDIVGRLAALRQGEWMSEMEFYGQKEDLLKQIDSMPDYPKKLQARMMLPKVGFISEKDYLSWRQRCIDEIFSPYASMDEFKMKANNLMEMQKAGVITETEFVDFKSKLMSEL